MIGGASVEDMLTLWALSLREPSNASSAIYAGAGRDLGGAVFRWTVGQRTAQDGLDAGGNGRQ